MRFLSLLLIIPFLCMQVWAIRGGPYDSLNGREISTFAGTYGVSMRGMQRVPLGVFDDESVVNRPLTYREPDPAGDNDVSTTAVLYLTVPNSGIVNGKIMLFHKGLMYIGTSTGMVERKKMSILMLSELTHYVVLSGTEFRYIVSESSGSISAGTGSTIPFAQGAALYQSYGQGAGLSGSPRSVMDSMLAGQIDLTLSMNVFTGLISVDGWANYVDVGGGSNSPQNLAILSGGSNSAGQSVTRDIVTSTIKVDNGTILQGDWKMQPLENVWQPKNTKVNGFNGLKLKAQGSRNTTETVAIANFIAPRSGTYWQIWGGVPSDLYGSNSAAGSGGGDGASAATAALASVSNVANNVVGGTQVAQIQSANTGTLAVNPAAQVPVQIPVPTQTIVNPTTGGGGTTPVTTNPGTVNPATDPTFMQRFLEFLNTF